MAVSSKALQDFYSEIEIMVQDNEGAIALFLQARTTSGGDAVQGLDEVDAQERVFQSCLGRALERYTVDRPLTGGGLHYVTEAETTIVETDFFAVCKLAAGELCGDLSRYFTHSGDGNMLNTSMANYRTLGDMFASREKRLKDEYAMHVGQSQTPTSINYAAGQVGATREEIASRLAPDHGMVAKRRIRNMGDFW